MSVPYVFTPNVTIKSSEVNANFADLVTTDRMDVGIAYSGEGDSTAHSSSSASWQNIASCSITLAGPGIIIAGGNAVCVTALSPYLSYLNIATPSGATARSTTSVTGRVSLTTTLNDIVIFTASAGTYIIQLQYAADGSNSTTVNYDSVWAIGLGSI